MEKGVILSVEMSAIISEIKLELTGTVLDMEIEDSTIELVVKKALRKLERYFDETTLVTIPFASCIELGSSELDLKEKVSSIVKVYRNSANGTSNSSAISDPLYMQQYMMFSNGGLMYNLSDYVLNYCSWNTMLQLKNTISTDMAFKEDRHNNRLYINCYMDSPQKVTVEYIPKLTDVEQIQSDYWIDILIKMSTALTKIILGRIRTRYTQSSAAWTQDGDKLLEEGNSELKELEEVLKINSNMIFGID